MNASVTIFASLLLASTPALADTVQLTDGTRRQGTVVSRNEEVVLLRIDTDGIRATLALPTNRISSISLAPQPATSAAPHASVAATMPATVPSPAKAPEIVVESLFSPQTDVPVDPPNLPENFEELWSDAVRRDVLGKRAATLEALRALDDAVLPVNGGLDRLDALCRQERQESFGGWMAQVHWDVLKAKYTLGQFDLTDVREAERKPLIGILKENTRPALEPLQSFFPPVDEKTGQPTPFKPAQLQGITVNNALEIKQQASYASAVLLAQLRLDPRMPAIDRALLSGQLQSVRRILARTSELEPSARAALEKSRNPQVPPPSH